MAAELVAEVADIIFRSLVVSALATIMASSWSIPMAGVLATKRPRAGNVFLDAMNALVSVPTVVIGLLLYMLLSSSGPFGFLRLLYTPLAISIGQAVLITPLMIVLTYNALSGTRMELWEVAITMGASSRQAAITMILESIPGIASAILITFNRAVGELGIALMLGGDIKGYTRVISTAIALETAKGDFELAMLLGGVFLATTLCISFLVRRVVGRG